jgi:small subunit ribosomal protein S16
MLRIRLRRVGSKGQPSYRIVVADSRSPRDGRFIEKIGFYNPRTEPATVEFDEARALHWLNNGAKPSDAVQYMLEKNGTIERLGRMRAGEEVETLVAEADAAAKVRASTLDLRTRRDDLRTANVSKRMKARAEAAAAAPPKAAPAPEPAAEVEAEATEAEAEPEAAAEAAE